MKHTKKIATASIFTALCVLFLFIGSIFQTLDLSAAALGSLIILFCMIELDNKMAIGVYLSSSVISLLIVPYKNAVVYFILFFGFYPILKSKLNQIRPFWLSYLARFLCLNTFLGIIFCLFMLLLKQFINVSEFLNSDGTINSISALIIFVLANITFFVYDIALERVANTYIVKIRPLIFKRG